MSRPSLVLIHGGSHSSACWQPTVEELARQAPDLKVLAVDLPGRGSVPADLGEVTISDWVASTVEQIERAALDEVVLVAHSMGGLTAPGVAATLGAGRVRRLVLVAACIPPEGGTVMDTLSPILRKGIERQARKGGAAPPLAKPLASLFFCNGMTKEQRAFTLAQLCPDASRVAQERVSRRDLPTQIPRSWVLTRRDRSLRPRQQREFMANLGGVEEVTEIDSCHDVMIRAPRRLAEVLIGEVDRPSPSVRP
jgi:pimeloyl-ACP methyl ester carboxylesterase